MADHTTTAQVPEVLDDEFDRMTRGGQLQKASGIPPQTATTAGGRTTAPTKPAGPTVDEDLEPWEREDTYEGISEKPVSEAQAEALCSPVTDSEVDIKPTSSGEVYLSHAGYRRRLNLAFRPGGWALKQMSKYVFDRAKGVAMADYALYAEGRFLGMAKGGMRLVENNDEMNIDDVIEGVKSNALMRACKDIGMALECWDLKWTTSFRKRLCVKVWVKRGDGKPRMQWRRLDADPFYGETGCVQDSPNKAEYEASKRSASENVKAGQLEGVSDELKASIEKGCELVGLTPGQRTAKINEFLGGVEPSHRDVAAQKFYYWLRSEYAKKKAGGSEKGTPDNGKAARASTSAAPPVSPTGDTASEALGASAPNAADSEHSSQAAPTVPNPSAPSPAGPVGVQNKTGQPTPKADLF